MRRDLLIAVSAVCVAALFSAAIVAVSVIERFRRPLPVAQAQTTGDENGGFILATGQSQGGSDQVLWVLETGTRKLACYVMVNRSLDYRGVREITFDLLPQEFAPKGAKGPSVAEMEEAARSAGRTPPKSQP